MGTLNALSNYDKLSKLFLDKQAKHTIGSENISGETVIIAAIDGKMKIIDYGGSFDDIKYKRASLFMTERHAVVYQSGKDFHSDYGIAIPYSRLLEIKYKVMRDSKKKANFYIQFIPKSGSNLPIVYFTTDIVDVFAYDGILMTLSSACALGGIRLTDESHINELADLGLLPLRI